QGMLARAIALLCLFDLTQTEPQKGNRVVPLIRKGGLRSSEARGQCSSWRPGDCDAALCGGFCEARFLRFHDRELGGDRSLKSCSCFRDRLCSVLGTTGCRSYATLNSFAQRMIRQWTSEGARNGLSYKEDKKRHMQLIFGNSLFCCHSSTPRPRALALRRNSADSAHFRLPYLALVVAGLFRMVY
ncbi:hypothetical protein PFISCL1PPCAC_12001, partial [Pristionchus fissidentatus]